MSAGIDYGMGRTNIDVKTGIRYGVISQHSVSQAWCDSSEADYGEPNCPECGGELKDFDESIAGDWEGNRGCNDYMCIACEAIYDSCDAFGEEPQGFSFSGDGYELVDCLDSDIMVLKSPYYTRAVFCSPCVPGACSIESPDDDGEKVYCLGHDWFEDGKATYPVFSVETDEAVDPA